MTTTMLYPGSTTVRHIEVPSWDNQVHQRSQTLLMLDALDKDISAVLGAWGDGVAQEVNSHEDEIPRDAVGAVAFVESLLGVSQEEVIKAAGIAERTFFGWKNDGRTPRTATQGHLWPMVQVVKRLADVHPNLSAWFHGSEEAKAAFQAGDVNALATAEMNWAIRTLETPRSYRPGDADLTGGPRVAWDPIESEDLADAESME